MQTLSRRLRRCVRPNIRSTPTCYHLSVVFHSQARYLYSCSQLSSFSSTMDGPKNISSEGRRRSFSNALSPLSPPLSSSLSSSSSSHAYSTFSNTFSDGDRYRSNGNVHKNTIHTDNDSDDISGNYSNRNSVTNTARPVGKIEMIIGPMFSGKTTELMRRIKRFQCAHRRCLVIKHSIDTRYDKTGDSEEDQVENAKAHEGEENHRSVDVDRNDGMGKGKGFDSHVYTHDQYALPARKCARLYDLVEDPSFRGDEGEGSDRGNGDHHDGNDDHSHHHTSHTATSTPIADNNFTNGGSDNACSQATPVTIPCRNVGEGDPSTVRTATDTPTPLALCHSLESAHVIGIDEGQFFPDLVSFSQDMASRGKIVIIAALDGTFERKPFHDVLDLIPVAEDVTKIKAVCMRCRDAEAPFTERLIDDTAVEVVGGADIYRAVCRSCYER